MRKFCPYRTAFLLGTPIAAIVLTTYYIATQPFNLVIWLWFAFFYVFSIFGITAGYHRYFAHRAYDAHPALKWFYALFGAAALQNSILIWSRDHRVHHRFVDTESDPYNINRGFWYAHMGWMMLEEAPKVDVRAYGRDLENDPVVKFQHKYYLPLALVMCFGVPTLLGWMAGSALGGFAVIGALRLVCVHHVTFFINSWCHLWGTQTYDDKQTARDSALLAVFTMGEGYHNFHHTFGNDYRNGVKWYHWDPTKWFIAACYYSHLAFNLKRTPHQVILAKQMEAVEKRVKSSWALAWEQSYQEKLDGMRSKIDAAHARLEQLKSEYKAMKAEYASAGRERIDEIKRQLRVAREDFKLARRQWREYTSLLLRNT